MIRRRRRWRKQLEVVGLVDVVFVLLSAVLVFDWLEKTDRGSSDTVVIDLVVNNESYSMTVSVEVDTLYRHSGTLSSLKKRCTDKRIPRPTILGERTAENRLVILRASPAVNGEVVKIVADLCRRWDVHRLMLVKRQV